MKDSLAIAGVTATAKRRGRGGGIELVAELAVLLHHVTRGRIKREEDGEKGAEAMGKKEKRGEERTFRNRRKGISIGWWCCSWPAVPASWSFWRWTTTRHQTGRSYRRCASFRGHCLPSPIFIILILLGFLFKLVFF